VTAARIDHVAVPTRDPEAAAAWLGTILGVEVGRDGAENEFPCLRLTAGGQLLFQATAMPAALHLAFRVAVGEFAGVVARLRAANVPIGNDPEGVPNGEIGDPLGGHGRVYFTSADGHLFEVCA
jgi:catechol 2,3-dioxygenase-like lactoylglutathione lyase family enzyme